ALLPAAKRSQARGELCGIAGPSQFGGDGAGDALWRCDLGRLHRRGQEHRRDIGGHRALRAKLRHGDGAIAPSLAFNGLDPDKVKLLGSGLWDDAGIVKEQTLNGGWFAAPEPNADEAFNDKYRAVYGAAPSQLAS